MTKTATKEKTDTKKKTTTKKSGRKTSSTKVSSKGESTTKDPKVEDSLISPKNVQMFGASSSNIIFSNVNRIVTPKGVVTKITRKSDSVVLWQSAKPLDSTNTTITINPTGYSSSDSSKTYTYSNLRPNVVSVKYNDGTSTVDLGTDDWDLVGYEGDSGTITHEDRYDSPKTNQAKLTIQGKGNYSGNVDKGYSISHTYEPESFLYTMYVAIYNKLGNVYPYKLATKEQTQNVIVSATLTDGNSDVHNMLPSDGRWQGYSYESKYKAPYTFSITVGSGYTIDGWSIAGTTSLGDVTAPPDGSYAGKTSYTATGSGGLNYDYCMVYLRPTS